MSGLMYGIPVLQDSSVNSCFLSVQTITDPSLVMSLMLNVTLFSMAYLLYGELLYPTEV